MRITNESGGNAANVFSDLLRLQSEFHSRLAEETLRYFRRIQGSSVPAAPGTVMVPDGSVELTASGVAGGSVTLEIEIENLQRMHSIVTPALSPLVEQSGTTWLPECDYSLPALIAPREVVSLKLQISIPERLPAGTYRGALFLQGFQHGAIPVAITVGVGAAPNASRPSAKKVKRPKARPLKRAGKESRT
jgi:hypothetical protein